MKILSILFTVIALVAAGASGGVFFLTKGKLEESNAELSTTRTSLDTAQVELDKAKTQILTTDQLLKNVRAELAEAKQQNTSLSRKLVGMQSRAQESGDSIGALESQLAELKKDNANMRRELLTRANAIPEGSSSGVSDEVVSAYKSEIADLEKQVSRLESQLSAAKSQTAASTSYTGSASATVRPVSSPSASSNNTLQGSIARVNVQSGLLVLAIGSAHGIQPKGEYTLTKGGYVLAKIQVTNLTPDYAVANILPNVGIPNSLRKGDTVVVTQ